MAVAVRPNEARTTQVLWLGAGEVPNAIATALLTRGVRIAEGEVHATPPGRLAVATQRGVERRATRADLSGRRIVVLHPDAERANLLSWALSARGALTRTFEPSAVEAVAAFDADAVLVDRSDCFLDSFAHVSTIWQHPRLRWTPCVLMSWAQLESNGEAELDAVCLTVRALCAEFDVMAALSRRDQPVQVSFASLGPTRALRALLEHTSAREVRIATARVTMEVHISNRMILGASGRFTDGSSIELKGARALACLVAEETGTMHVSPLLGTPLSNVMASLDDALVRGPDGAWLADSLVASLPDLSDISDVRGAQDETLMVKRKPLPGDFSEKHTPTLLEPVRTVELADHDLELLGEDDPEERVPTLRMSIQSLLDRAASVRKPGKDRKPRAFALRALSTPLPHRVQAEQDAPSVEAVTKPLAAAPAPEPAVMSAPAPAAEPAPERSAVATHEPAAAPRKLSVAATRRSDAPSVRAPRLREDELRHERPSGIRFKQRAPRRTWPLTVLALSILLAGVLSVDSDRVAVEAVVLEGAEHVETWLTHAARGAEHVLRDIELPTVKLWP